jgi:hypothetical protein
MERMVCVPFQLRIRPGRQEQYLLFHSHIKEMLFSKDIASVSFNYKASEKKKLMHKNAFHSQDINIRTDYALIVLEEG